MTKPKGTLSDPLTFTDLGWDPVDSAMLPKEKKRREPPRTLWPESFWNHLVGLTHMSWPVYQAYIESRSNSTILGEVPPAHDLSPEVIKAIGDRNEKMYKHR